MDKREPWHAERIKAELRVNGSSLARIAEELGVSKPVVSCAVRYRNRRSRRVETAVASVVGVSAAEIWPDRYPCNSSERAA